MKSVHTLIDYDNVKVHPETTTSGVELNLAEMLSSIGAAIRAKIPDSEEISCRLYGGWWTKGMQMTERATWLLAEVPKFRGRRHAALRTRLGIAQAIMVAPDSTLMGTHRSEGQKMVDGMISADIFELSSQTDTSLVLISDDDDFVPCLLGGGLRRRQSNPILLLRRDKPPGSAPNDNLLTSTNVVIAKY